MKYMPKPDTISESHVGYEVVEGLDDPTLDKKYGFIEGLDSDGKVRVKFGSGNAKKRPPEQLKFCLFQHKIGVMLVNPSYFHEEDSGLSEEEQQRAVQKRYMDHMQGRNNEKTGKSVTPEERSARVAEAKGEKSPAKKKRSSSKKKSTSSSKKKSVSKKKTSQAKQSDTPSSKKKTSSTTTRAALLATAKPKAGI